MSQFDFGNLESPLSGADLINDNLEPFRDALHTTHSGTTRPTYVQAGMIWLDTSGTQWLLKMFQGSDDIVIGALDTSGLKFGITGGTVNNTPIGQATPAAGTFTTLRYTQDLDFSSDRSFKRDILPLIKSLNPLQLVNKLLPVTYYRKTEDSRKYLGFIAQDVQKVMPAMTGKDENGKLTLHGMDMIALLVGAVQQLSAQVAGLDKQVKELEAKS